MSPKRKDRTLPHRVTLKHGSYYYLKPTIKNGKPGTSWIKLGKTEPEMLRALADLKTSPAGTMQTIIERYRNDVLTTKAKNTQATQNKQLDKITKTFGHMKPADIRPAHIAKYHDIIGKTAPYQANRELALIKHVLKSAVRWGHIEKTPREK